jgi:hypothetical protein
MERAHSNERMLHRYLHPSQLMKTLVSFCFLSKERCKVTLQTNFHVVFKLWFANPILQSVKKLRCLQEYRWIILSSHSTSLWWQNLNFTVGISRGGTELTIVVTGEMQDKFMTLWRIWKGFTSAEIRISDLPTKFSACVSHLNSLILKIFIGNRQHRWETYEVTSCARKMSK